MRSLKKRGPHVLDDLNDLLFSLQRPKDTVQKLLLFSALAFVSSKQPRSCVAFRQVPIT